jgi:hypothetical protein
MHQKYRILFYLYLFGIILLLLNNSVAVSSGWGVNRCITIIAIESQKVMTTISMDTNTFGMAVRGRIGQLPSSGLAYLFF